MVLDGHQFFAHEISPVLALAHTLTINAYNETDDPTWLSANVAIASTKVKVNSIAVQDEFREPTAIRKGDPLWAEIDAVLRPVASDPDVFAMVAELPRDAAPLAASASWVRPVATVLALGALIGVGYHLTRR